MHGEGTLVPETVIAEGRGAKVLRAALIFCLWSIPGLISASQLHFVWMPDMPLDAALLWQMPPWWFWALVTPLVLALGRRFRLEKGSWLTSVPVHLIANTVLAAGHLTVAVVFGRLAGQSFYQDALPTMLWKMGMKQAHLELIIYWGVVAAGMAAEYHRRFRERALAAAQLETKLAQAQLDALKMQLHPHFLFNTLHAISVLVRKQDTQGSIQMISGLSELLRLALDSVGRQVVPLKQELDFVDRYLEIERIRFQDRLRVVRDIAPGVLDAEVPNLILQPLVENAIRHGIAARAAAGEIVLGARREGDTLILTVRDDGAGLRAEHPEGLGLRNVRARLQQLYGRRGRARLEAAPGGTLATVEVPFRRG